MIIWCICDVLAECSLSIRFVAGMLALMLATFSVCCRNAGPNASCLIAFSVCCGNAGAQSSLAGLVGGIGFCGVLLGWWVVLNFTSVLLNLWYWIMVCRCP